MEQNKFQIAGVKIPTHHTSRNSFMDHVYIAVMLAAGFVGFMVGKGFYIKKPCLISIGIPI